MMPRKTQVFKSFNQIKLEQLEQEKKDSKKKPKKATTKQLETLVTYFKSRHA